MLEQRSNPFITLSRAAILAGPAMIFMAVAAQRVVSAITWRSGAFLIPAVLGLALFVIGTLINRKWLMALLARRKTLIGLNVWFMVFLALLVLIISNAIVAGTPQTAGWAADMTASGAHTLSEQTRNILGGLEAEVRITGFIGAGEVMVDSERIQLGDRVRALLKLYDAQGGRVETEIIDVDVDRTRAAQYLLEMQEEVPRNSIIVQAGGRHVIVSFDDLLDLPATSPYQAMEEGPGYGFRGEERISAAILEATEESQKKIYFLTGHGELAPKGDADKALNAFSTELQRGNYLVDVLNLGVSGQVPPDCDLLVIAGPMTALQAEETEAIQVYLKAGGKLFALVRPKVFRGSIVGLREILSEYDVEVQDDLVVIETGREPVTGNVVYSLKFVPMEYAIHPITEGMSALNMIVEEACPILGNVGETPRAGMPSPRRQPYQVAPLMFTTSNGWAESNLAAANIKFDKGKDIRGPISLGVAVSPRRPGAANAPQNEMRMVVVGTPGVASDSNIGQFTGNRTFVLNCVNWLLQRETRLGIPPQRPEHRELRTDEHSLRAMFFITVVAMPLSVALAGIVVWWVRRR